MINDPQQFRDLFYNGMKRGLPDYLPVAPGGTHLNLGSGNHPIKGAVNLDPNGDRHLDRNEHNFGHSYCWKAPVLPYDDERIAAIHAYHFFEHLYATDMTFLVREMARVLKPGGVVYYCVPYAMAPISYMDIDHKTFWTEETMRTLLESRGYQSGATKELTIGFQIIAGVTSQNLAVLGVLQKTREN